MWTCYTVTSVLHISQLCDIKGITGWVRLKWITFGKSRTKVRRSSFDLWGMENKHSQWQYCLSFLSQKWAFCLLNTTDMFPIKASSQVAQIQDFNWDFWSLNSWNYMRNWVCVCMCSCIHVGLKTTALIKERANKPLWATPKSNSHFQILFP